MSEILQKELRAALTDLIKYRSSYWMGGSISHLSFKFMFEVYFELELEDWAVKEFQFVSADVKISFKNSELLILSSTKQ